MAIKCLNEYQKRYVMYHYHKKLMSQKQLAQHFDVSERSIHRVLVEAGLATPVARIKGEAHQVMQLLKHYGLDIKTLKAILDSTEGLNANQA